MRGADEGGMVDKSDLLRPVDVAARIHDVLFTVGQVCTIARITKMQLDLWTERASISTLGVKQRLYDTDAVEHVIRVNGPSDHEVRDFLGNAGDCKLVRQKSIFYLPFNANLS